MSHTETPVLLDFWKFPQKPPMWGLHMDYGPHDIVLLYHCCCAVELHESPFTILRGLQLYLLLLQMHEIAQ